MIKKLLAATAATVVLAGCGSYDPPPPGQPAVKSSADQTVPPVPVAAPPGVTPMPTGYPLGRAKNMEPHSVPSREERR